MQRTPLPADERTAVAACLGLQSVTRLRAKGAQGLEGFPDNRRVIVLLDDHRHAQVLFGGYRHTPSYLDDFGSALADIRARTSAELVAASARSGETRDAVLLSYCYDVRTEPKLRLGKLLNSQRVILAEPIGLVQHALLVSVAVAVMLRQTAACSCCACSWLLHPAHAESPKNSQAWLCGPAHSHDCAAPLSTASLLSPISALQVDLKPRAGSKPPAKKLKAPQAGRPHSKHAPAQPAHQGPPNPPRMSPQSPQSPQPRPRQPAAKGARQPYLIGVPATSLQAAAPPGAREACKIPLVPAPTAGLASKQAPGSQSAPQHSADVLQLRLAHAQEVAQLREQQVADAREMAQLQQRHAQELAQLQQQHTQELRAERSGRERLEDQLHAQQAVIDQARQQERAVLQILMSHQVPCDSCNDVLERCPLKRRFAE